MNSWSIYQYFLFTVCNANILESLGNRCNSGMTVFFYVDLRVSPQKKYAIKMLTYATISIQTIPLFNFIILTIVEQKYSKG